MRERTVAALHGKSWSRRQPSGASAGLMSECLLGCNVQAPQRPTICIDDALSKQIERHLDIDRLVAADQLQIERWAPRAIVDAFHRLRSHRALAGRNPRRCCSQPTSTRGKDHVHRAMAGRLQVVTAALEEDRACRLGSLCLLLPANRTAREHDRLHQTRKITPRECTHTHTRSVLGPVSSVWLAWQIEVDAMVVRHTSRLTARPQQCQGAHLHRSLELHTRRTRRWANERLAAADGWLGAVMSFG